MGTIEIYKDAMGEWRWRLVARNGNTLADSGEGYKNLKDCKRMVRRLRLYSVLSIVTVRQVASS